MFYSDEFIPPKREKSEPHLDFCYTATRAEMKKYIEDNQVYIDNQPNIKNLGNLIIGSFASFESVEKANYSTTYLAYDERDDKANIGNMIRPLRDHSIDSEDKLIEFFVQFADAVHRAKQTVFFH
jgi:hypothetical protein